MCIGRQSRPIFIPSPSFYPASPIFVADADDVTVKWTLCYLLNTFSVLCILACIKSNIVIMMINESEDDKFSYYKLHMSFLSINPTKLSTL
jgi:hypothetical protein